MKEKHLTVLIYDKEFFQNVWINNIYNSIIKWQITKLDSKHPHVLSSFMWISRTGKIISDRKQISGWTRAHGYRRDCLKNSRLKLLGGKKSALYLEWDDDFTTVCLCQKLLKGTFSMVLVCCAKIILLKVDLKIAVSSRKWSQAWRHRQLEGEFVS